MSGHLILGKDVANDNYVPISVDSSGHLDIDVQVADLDSKCMASETGATDGQQRQARCNTSGELLVNFGSSTTQNVNCFGKDGGGTPRELLVESNGAFVLGGGSSSALGNTATDGSGDAKFLLCDAQGHLQVDIVSMSGGGDASAANQTTQIANQGTINTSLGTVNTSVGTVNSTLGDTNSKIDAMRGSSDLGVINTSLGTVNSSIGDTNSKIDAMRGTSDLGVINTSLGTVNTSIGTSNTTLTDIEAHQGNIENNLSSIQSTVSSNKLQVDVITSALPSGAATETTLAAAEVHLGAIDTSCSSIQSNVSTSSNQGTMITSLASLAGCVSGTELQVDIVSGGGGGSSSANSYLNATLTVLAPTGAETTKITATPSIDLLNISNITQITINTIDTNYTMIDKVAVEYSYDNSVFFTNLGSAGSPSFNDALDIAGIQRTDNGIPFGSPGAGNRVYNATVFPDMDGARYARVVFLHQQNTSSGGANVDVVPIIVLNGK